MFSTSLIIVILLALIFDFINGFHDTANSIATVVSTKVMKYWQAIVMAACLNFVGAFVSDKVAKTISGGVINGSLPEYVIMAAILAGIVWDLITWWYGIPSSSSHALIGGLVGASIMYAGSLKIVIVAGVIKKVVLPLIISPIFGFIVAFLFMKFLFFLLSNLPVNLSWDWSKPSRNLSRWLSRFFVLFMSRRLSLHYSHRVSRFFIPDQFSFVWLFSKLQILSAAFMSFEHGKNDAQKSMGIITLALISAGNLHPGSDVPWWVVLMCALTMAAGTSVGGKKIINKMGDKAFRGVITPIDGFAAETTAAVIISAASAIGAPVSTTHVVSSSIMGVGAARSRYKVRWNVAKDILNAWVFTIPMSMILGALITLLLKNIFT